MSKGFAERLRQPLTGVLTWDGLSALWGRVMASDGWYLYTVGGEPPAAPSSRDETTALIRDLDERLRREHGRDECGIVYADDLAAPALIKVYDPKRLGVACGPSRGPVPPCWILSRMPPERIDLPQPERTRFRLFRGLSRSATDS